MARKNFWSALKDIPYLYCAGQTVIEAGAALFDLISYDNDELIQMPVNIIFEKLRATFSIQDYINSDGACAEEANIEGFIFTSELEAREVTVTIKKLSNNEALIIIEEKPNARIENRLLVAEQMYNHNIVGVGIFCVQPAIILLKANQTFLDLFLEPYNLKCNTIGKRIDEFMSGWIGSTSEDIWRNILKTGQPYYSDQYVYKWA